MNHTPIGRVSLMAGIVATVCWLMSVASVHGQGFTLQIYENGSGTFNRGNHLGFLQNNPGPGSFPNALTYTLPAGLVVGDLLLHEPFSVESDLVRWNPNDTLVFYSDIPTEPGEGPDMADIGLPGGAWPNGISRMETGLVLNPVPIMVPYSENGINGYIYTPVAGQPGWDPNNVGNPPTYIIVSDVPEPSTIVLVGMSVISLLVVRRRQRA
jgi:hypothetical protein